MLYDSIQRMRHKSHNSFALWMTWLHMHFLHLCCLAFRYGHLLTYTQPPFSQLHVLTLQNWASCALTHVPTHPAPHLQPYPALLCHFSLWSHIKRFPTWLLRGTKCWVELCWWQVHSAGRSGQRQCSSQDHGFILTSESSLFSCSPLLLTLCCEQVTCSRNPALEPLFWAWRSVLPFANVLNPYWAHKRLPQPFVVVATALRSMECRPAFSNSMAPAG